VVQIHSPRPLTLCVRPLTPDMNRSAPKSSFQRLGNSFLDLIPRTENPSTAHGSRGCVSDKADHTSYTNAKRPLVYLIESLGTADLPHAETIERVFDNGWA